MKEWLAQSQGSGRLSNLVVHLSLSHSYEVQLARKAPLNQVVPLFLLSIRRNRQEKTSNCGYITKSHQSSRFLSLISLEQRKDSSGTVRTLDVKHDRRSDQSYLYDYKIGLTSGSTTERNMPTRLIK